MTRIRYLLPGAAAATGGTKTIFRHVETLAAAGFDAAVRLPEGDGGPRWFTHAAPIEPLGAPLASDDILVLPEDAGGLMRAHADRPNRRIVFCQSPNGIIAYGLAREPAPVRARYRAFMANSPGTARWLSRYFDPESVGVVPAFADERLFAPAPKTRTIAVIPAKRPEELRVIRYLFSRIHPRADAWRWDVIEGRDEAATAAALARASVFLALPRMESLSLAVLEAMASGCLVAGFTGIGPREYMTAMNGLWAADDDCEAAAAALSRACAIAEEDAASAHLMRHAALTTAAQWSHAAFAEALTAFWRAETVAERPAAR